MEKTKVVVDTCFLKKLSSDGKHVENVKKVLEELDFIPVVHPYCAEHELEIEVVYKALLDEHYIEKIEYNSFIGDPSSKSLYEGYFMSLHEELRKHLAAKKGKKQIKALDFSKRGDIYTTHIQGSSMADVHTVLMAYFLNLPIVLTEDTDIDFLRSAVKRKMKVPGYTLTIYDALDLIKQIASNPSCKLIKAELETILDQMKGRKHRTDVREIWSQNHQSP